MEWGVALRREFGQLIKFFLQALSPPPPFRIFDPSSIFLATRVFSRQEAWAGTVTGQATRASADSLRGRRRGTLYLTPFQIFPSAARKAGTSLHPMGLSHFIQDPIRN